MIVEVKKAWASKRLKTAPSLFSDRCKRLRTTLPFIPPSIIHHHLEHVIDNLKLHLETNALLKL